MYNPTLKQKKNVITNVKPMVDVIIVQLDALVKSQLCELKFMTTYNIIGFESTQYVLFKTYVVILC